MKSITQSITSCSDIEIEVFKSGIDQRNFLVRDISRLSVASIVRKLK